MDKNGLHFSIFGKKINLSINLFSLVRNINDQKSRVIEGELRCGHLATFLDAHKTEKVVWLSEDATALASKINYDPITNQLVGIILPTNGNGCPIPFRCFLHDFLLLMSSTT